jgi:hypothetical protein
MGCDEMMSYPIPSPCPVCSHPLHITELHCEKCATTVRGRFTTNALHRLSREQLDFVEVFIKCRGNIKEVERELGISYPTVRSKLEQIIEAMGYPAYKPNSEESKRRKEILERLNKGEISTEEALRILNQE